MDEFNLPGRRPELLPPFVAELQGQGEGAVALFDADGTLWRDDVADDFTRHAIDSGLISGDLWGRYLEIYREDHAEGCRYLLSLYGGLSREALHASIWGWWRERARRSWVPEALEALYFLAEAGFENWIVTGSPTDTMLPLRDFLPVHQIVGMDFEVDGAGRLTGRHEGISCADAGKADKVRSMLRADQRVLFAAGNGSLDQAMMELSSALAWAVYPNAAFEVVARAKGWPILARPADFVEESKLA